MEKTPSKHEARLFHVGLLIAGAAFVDLAIPALLNRIYGYDDLIGFHYPLRRFYQDCLVHGDNFLWLPNLFCGMYLLGEGQAGLLHPLHLLLYRALPLTVAFNVEFLGMFLVMITGSYAFLRRLRLPRDAALFGATLATFGGFFFLHSVHLNCDAILAHVPWLLVCIDVALRGERRRLPTAALGIVVLTTSQLLLGHAQFVYLSLLVEGLFVAFTLRSSPRRSAVVIIAAAKLLALIVAAVQLAPTMDFLLQSNRGAPVGDMQYSFSLHPFNVLQLVSPGLFSYGVFSPDGGNTQELCMYAGAVAPVLVAWAIIRRHALRPHWTLLLAATIMVLLGLLLAMGNYSPLYRLWAAMFQLDRFRCPARHVLLLHLGLILIAAVAYLDLARVSRSRSPIPYRRLWPLALPAAAGIVVSVIVTGFGRHGVTPGGVASAIDLGTWREIAQGLGAVAVATLLVIAGGRGWRLAPAFVFAFAVVDLLNYGETFLRRDPPNQAEAVARNWGLPRLETGDRIITPQDPDTDIWMLRDAHSAGGYAGLYPRRRLDYSVEAALRVAGVRWREASPHGAAWQEVPNVLPRARLVTRTSVSADPARDIAAIDVNTTALVDEALDLPTGQPGTVRFVNDRPGRVVLATDAPTRQLLVLADSYHEGWKARVDGRDELVRRVNGDFMGCVVGPGRHTVEWHFAPASFAIGLAITIVGHILTLIGWLALALACRDRKPARATHPATQPAPVAETSQAPSMMHRQRD